MPSKNGVFQISKSKTRRAKLPKKPQVMSIKPAEEITMRPIHGQWPDSRDELVVSIALDRMQMEYDYQVYTPGIVGVQGTYSIDFLVFTLPMPTPLEVKGKHWHEGLLGIDDELREAEINEQYSRRWKEIVSIDTANTQTVEQATIELKRLLWR